MKTRMLLNLYSKPLVSLLLGIVTYLFLAIFIPNGMSGSPLFQGLVDQSMKIAPLIFSLFCLVSIGWACIQTYKYWRWERGNAECCSSCGGIITQKFGRYGAYVHCLACGKNRSN
ncbi:hypothetical protein FCL47_20455 [Desulfopila sp. IMCC35006]|uniref:hypothetical protein n=1 Tax=Desulfopila sp. IMCC35006 TaxID=2569542 RepID=UPI0010AC5F63|nr:hypothetical protein [Desulfopila sp. IMCC35006]TKB23855.1 hypothetical protein FCL47_20455 [Desulfopila sp. IMCC35006]